MKSFWAKVWKSDECWEWQGYRNPAGYGKFRYKGKSRRAHRVSWELEHGPIPVGLHVCHKCDNPRCVRPDHLFLGTHADNMRDLFAKGRRIARADKNNAWKLTEAEVREIRDKYALGFVSYRDLADQYGVTNQYIGQIVRRERWAYVA